ncbi:MAG: hypothetical protein KatS3mg003_2372 [Candidatus Nitrosocaldaceae archaeon]|nr:MAG: hypothetical protein KatS3mg003_2372 [Candidatus Nitrosocaldaceae archaeon]
MDNNYDERELDMLYEILSDMERLGYFEIKTTPKERKKIARYIRKIIKERSENELVEKGSGRWI